MCGAEAPNLPPPDQDDGEDGRLWPGEGGGRRRAPCALCSYHKETRGEKFNVVQNERERLFSRPLFNSPPALHSRYSCTLQPLIEKYHRICRRSIVLGSTTTRKHTIRRLRSPYYSRIKPLCAAAGARGRRHFSHVHSMCGGGLSPRCVFVCVCMYVLVGNRSCQLTLLEEISRWRHARVAVVVYRQNCQLPSSGVLY